MEKEKMNRISVCYPHGLVSASGLSGGPGFRLGNNKELELMHFPGACCMYSCSWKSAEDIFPLSSQTACYL